ncbi:hypothetical protein ACIQGO_28475 [Streptomyces shenzhenensis]|uniref:hypothetical protein n=1 Tax=Streptomyces shenzhenensis TaxID=943815 RepID=UPI00382B94E3
MVAEHRQRLSRGEDVVDPETRAGSVPAAQGIAPRMRVGRSKWFDLLWLLPIGWGVQRIGFAVIGPVQRLFEHGDATVAQWGGVSMATIMELVKPRPEARWVVFMPVCDTNGAPLSYGHGVAFVARFSEVGGGHGGYNPDRKGTSGQEQEERS